MIIVIFFLLLSNAINFNYEYLQNYDFYELYFNRDTVGGLQAKQFRVYGKSFVFNALRTTTTSRVSRCSERYREINKLHYSAHFYIELQYYI